jgi:hypothetical protein
MGTKGSRKNNSKSKSKYSSLLKSLKGGQDEEEENKKPSSLEYIKNLYSPSERNTPPKDYNSKIGEDNESKNDTNSTFGISFNSKKITSYLTPPTPTEINTSLASTSETSGSTGWFVFRVIIVLIIVLIFGLNLTGYLDNVIAWFTNTFGPYINPILVSIGLMESAPTKDSNNNNLTGDQSGTGTNSVTQLDQNVGINPVMNTPDADADADVPVQSTININDDSHRQLDNIKPIPIQPNERQTPLRNRGESARPPGTQPAPFTEETSREKEKEKSIKQALDYAAKNQYPSPNDTTSNKFQPKSGLCFIGEDRGNRACIEVSESDKCMSGNIFPSMDVCVNPNLRV